MNALDASYSNNILPAVWKLLVLRLRLTWNGFKHAKVWKKILIVAGYILILAFGAGVFVGSWFLLRFLKSPSFHNYVGLDATAFLNAVPVLIFAMLFGIILLSSFGVLLQALYLAGDMDFLLTSPVPLRAVFVAKMLQAVLPNFSLVSLFGLPILFGLGLAEHYNVLYYPLVVIAMAALTLAAAGISSLLVMLVVRVLPPRRAAEILGFLGATIGLVCGQLGNLYNGFGRNANISGNQMGAMFNSLARLNTLWMPFAWPGRGLTELGQTHWLAGLGLLAVALEVAGLIFGMALTTSERWYYTGWAGMQAVTNKKKTRRLSQAQEAATLEREENSTPLLRRILPAPVWAILWKDFLVYRRDLRNLSQLVSPLILGVIYTLLIFRTGGRGAADIGEIPGVLSQSLTVLLAYSSVGMSLFVGWMLLNRLASMAFSAEGRNFWLLKTSPLRTVYLLTAKFLVAYLPTFGLGLVFLLVIVFLQKMALGSFLYSLLAMGLCLAGMNGILLGFGAAGAKLDWEDPRKMNAGTLGCVGQVVTMVFLPLSFSLFIGPVALSLIFGWPAVYGYLIGGVAGTAVNAVAMILPPWLAQKKVERLGES